MRHLGQVFPFAKIIIMLWPRWNDFSVDANGFVASRAGSFWFRFEMGIAILPAVWGCGKIGLKVDEVSLRFFERGFGSIHKRVSMRKDAITNFLLLLIAVALLGIAARPYVEPAPAEAQSISPHSFYIEPGVQLLRAPDGSSQVYGKVVVDLRSGKIWGFPTGTLDPYPSSPIDNKPTTSRPFALGRFAFEDIDK